jgi:polysaccharide deacetylase family protein (PEP-CTERM system associated)
LSARLVNAMTVDVEDYFHVSAFANHISRDDWATMTPRVRRNTNDLLELFAARDVRATFFVLGWVAEQDLIREIAAAGHEVACHGFSHQLVYEQTPEQFRAETLRAKTCLEQIVQRPIRGYRAASYSIVKSSLWALDTLVELGFEYDSSIFPVRHDRSASGVRMFRARARRAARSSFRCRPRRAGMRLPLGGGLSLFPCVLRWAHRSTSAANTVHLLPPLVGGRLERLRSRRLIGRLDIKARPVPRPEERLLGDFSFDTVQTFAISSYWSLSSSTPRNALRDPAAPQASRGARVT